MTPEEQLALTMALRILISHQQESFQLYRAAIMNNLDKQLVSEYARKIGVDYDMPTM